MEGNHRLVATREAFEDLSSTLPYSLLVSLLFKLYQHFKIFLQDASITVRIYVPASSHLQKGLLEVLALPRAQDDARTNICEASLLTAKLLEEVAERKHEFEEVSFWDKVRRCLVLNT